jgi:hypothetical protein
LIREEGQSIGEEGRKVECEKQGKWGEKGRDDKGDKDDKAKSAGAIDKATKG